jgi:hypothetical protein
MPDVYAFISSTGIFSPVSYPKTYYEAAPITPTARTNMLKSIYELRERNTLVYINFISY